MKKHYMECYIYCESKRKEQNENIKTRNLQKKYYRKEDN